MRILVVTAGSRGDVAPYTGLGQRLQQAGHQVAIAAHGPFADLVRRCGLEHRPLPGDPLALVRDRLAAPSPEAARSVFADFLRHLGEGLVAATAAGTDLIVTAFGPAPLSRVVAEGFGIPSIGAYLVPAVPTAEFPLPGWPEPGDLGPDGNLTAGRQTARPSGGSLRRDPSAAARAARSASGRGDGAGRRKPAAGWPICHGFSPAVVPRPDDWPPEVQVTGYWWPAGPAGWKPPDRLLDFLRAGDPPVFFGFGSMAASEAESLSELVAAAVQRAGVRAVVQAGWAGLAPVGDEIVLVGDLPHDWLFPRMAAVVHHAGAGTTAAGLRAGVPAVAVPVAVDQPFWAARLHHLGVAPPPLPQQDLTANALAEATRSCVDDQTHRDRAVELGRRIRAEDGSAAVVALVDDLAG